MSFYPTISLDDSRLLLSNDDGVNAPGIKVLHKIAKSLSKDVWVCAPEVEQSGAGHSLTLRRPLRIHKHGTKRYAVDGTPTDSVLLGIRELLKGKKAPTLLLSGVNRGANLAEDVHYSGTVAAAMEGTLLGVPSIAFSQMVRRGIDPNWAVAETYAPDIIRKLLTIKWAQGVLMNVNFPDCDPAAVKGVRFARQGSRKMGEQLGQRVDMRGEPYYWIGPISEDLDYPEGTDVGLLSQGYITITPLQVDLTDDATAKALAGVFA